MLYILSTALFRLTATPALYTSLTELTCQVYLSTFFPVNYQNSVSLSLSACMLAGLLVLPAGFTHSLSDWLGGLPALSGWWARRLPSWLVKAESSPFDYFLACVPVWV